MTTAKTLLAVLMVTQAGTVFSNTPGLSTPMPGYPAAAYAAHVTGSGRCQVTFGPSGHVAKAVMLKSTGAAVLDDNTLGWAQAHWTGRPSTRVVVPVTYKWTGPVARPSGGVHVPMPPYPYQARAGYISGEGQVQVGFDASGRVSEARMAKSTGSGILDENTIVWAHANWTGRPNTTITVPVAYRLR